MHSMASYVHNEDTVCTIPAGFISHGGEPVDEEPFIHQANQLYGTNGTVVSSNHMFKPLFLEYQ